MRKQRKTRLSTKISALTVLSSTCAILFLGIALILMFTFFFSRQTREDIEYYLENTNNQFESKVQFIQDSAVSIRHNTIMEGFFKQNHYNEEEVETQLAYCMDLFSDRNMVTQNSPFAVSVYVFNNKDDFVRKHYYPTTLSLMEQVDVDYQALQQTYKQSGTHFWCRLDEDKADLCFRLFDDEMREMGICIVAIQIDALGSVFADSAKYQNAVWVVTSNGKMIAGSGNDDAMGALAVSPQNHMGDLKLNGKQFLAGSKTTGFGLQSAIAVSRSNIYIVLKPTLYTFILVLILVLALVTVIIFGVSRRSVRPLKEMAEEIRAFGEDNLNVRMKEFSVQEFQDISFVFNEMADRIDHLITEVYEKELLATRSQVKYLQAQINPHFQFNILAMLSIKAKLAGNEDLYQSLQAFSKLMQGKIFRDKEIKIPLSSEMELVNFYLLLQKGRYQNKLSYEIHYGSEDVKECLIPRLLIEPLVENAVSHGLEPKSEAGRIQIRIFESNTFLHIVVEDNGVGFDQNDLQQPVKEGHTSTGLSNTRRLLQILYRDNYSMTVEGKKNEGTRVEIILPVEKEVPHVESHGG